MSIAYTYEIVAVDEAARVMEVVYTAEGHPTQHIGARLPYEGESLEAVIEMYSPVRFWEELQSTVVAPVIGTAGSIEPFIPVPSNPADVIRQQRADLLKETDWTQLPDSPLSAEKKAEWAAYRQALRDITTQAGFPNNIQWPTQPE